MNGLITFYRHLLTNADDRDEKCKAIAACLAKSPFDEAVIVTILSDLKQFVINTPQDYLSAIRRLLIAKILHRFHEKASIEIESQIRSISQQISRASYWDEFQLGFAYSKLFTSLLGEEIGAIEVKQLVHGGTLTEGGSHALDGQVFEPQFTAELALCWIVLGWREKNDDLLDAGLKSADFLTRLCDQAGTPFTGLWLLEGTFSHRMLHSVYSLLFSVAEQFEAKTEFSKLQVTLLEQLKQQSISTSLGEELLFPLIAFLVQEEGLQPRHVELDRRTPFEGTDRSLGFLRYDSEDMSLACCASGVNTGLGALHKKKVKVASFGPHFYPLADSDRYGLFRTSNGSQDGFKDLKLEVKEEGSLFSGWSRLISPLPAMVANQNFTLAIPGDHWIFFDIKASANQTELDIAMSKCDPAHPLAFTFFVHANEARIEGEAPFMPRSLRQYQGESCSISFRTDDETLMIEPEFQDKEMLIIPLAGKNHFWGADFLIAFPIQEKLLHHRWSLY